MIDVGSWLGQGVSTVVAAAGGLVVLTFIGLLAQRWHEWQLRSYAKKQIVLLEQIKKLIGEQHGLNRNGKGRAQNNSRVKKD